MSFTSSNINPTAFPMLDMMMDLQRLGLRAMSTCTPFGFDFLDSRNTAEHATRTAFAGPTDGRRSQVRALQETNEEEVIGVGEEILNVGTRMVPGKTTRIRRIVVQTPVQQDVTLHTETVVLERRRPILSTGDDVLTEITVEMVDMNEVPVVSKSVHMVEEVLLRKEVTARVETIRDTVRRDMLEIDPPSNLPAEDPKMGEESPTDEIQDRKQPGGSPKTLQIRAATRSAR
jgi:hypothetical protein